MFRPSDSLVLAGPFLFSFTILPAARYPPDIEDSHLRICDSQQLRNTRHRVSSHAIFPTRDRRVN